MSRLIDADKLVKRIKITEEKLKADCKEDDFVEGILSGVFSVHEMVNQAPTVSAIPIDKVKVALQEENNQLDIADGFDEGIESGIANILRVLEELAESEDKE